jgi:hypothetical protein
MLTLMKIIIFEVVKASCGFDEFNIEVLDMYGSGTYHITQLRCQNVKTLPCQHLLPFDTFA